MAKVGCGRTGVSLGVVQVTYLQGESFSFFLFYLLEASHGMWDLSFLGSNPWPLRWQSRVLTTGPPGKSPGGSPFPASVSRTPEAGGGHTVVGREVGGEPGFSLPTWHSNMPWLMVAHDSPPLTLVSSVIRKHTTREPGAFSGELNALPETGEGGRRREQGREKEEVWPQKLCIMYSFL